MTETLSDKREGVGHLDGIRTYVYPEEDVKEFIERRIERIKLIINLYPHKKGEELAAQLIEDLINDSGKKLLEEKE